MRNIFLHPNVIIVFFVLLFTNTASAFAYTPSNNSYLHEMLFYSFVKYTAMDTTAPVYRYKITLTNASGVAKTYGEDFKGVHTGINVNNNTTPLRFDFKGVNNQNNPNQSGLLNTPSSSKGQPSIIVSDEYGIVRSYHHISELPASDYVRLAKMIFDEQLLLASVREMGVAQKNTDNNVTEGVLPYNQNLPEFLEDANSLKTISGLARKICALLIAKGLIEDKAQIIIHRNANELTINGIRQGMEIFDLLKPLFWKEELRIEKDAWDNITY